MMQHERTYREPSKFRIWYARHVPRKARIAIDVTCFLALGGMAAYLALTNPDNSANYLKQHASFSGTRAARHAPADSIRKSRLLSVYPVPSTCNLEISATLRPDYAENLASLICKGDTSLAFLAGRFTKKTAHALAAINGKDGAVIFNANRHPLILISKDSTFGFAVPTASLVGRGEEIVQNCIPGLMFDGMEFSGLATFTRKDAKYSLIFTYPDFTARKVPLKLSDPPRHPEFSVEKAVFGHVSYTVYGRGRQPERHEIVLEN